MAVDLADYVDVLRLEVNAPGTDSFPGAGDDEWLQRLIAAFWEARFDGLLATFTADEDGLVTPIKTTEPDMTRDLVQIIIFYAGMKAILNALRTMRTQFRATAGPVSFEYQQSANLLTEMLKSLVNRRDILLTRLSDLGTVPTYVFDAVIARDVAVRDGLTWFVGA